MALKLNLNGILYVYIYLSIYIYTIYRSIYIPFHINRIQPLEPLKQEADKTFFFLLLHIISLCLRLQSAALYKQF